ncbi:uncharacterized protein LOC111805087 [Cucurbita pepo subsp. pepo]|uniref:uncharacterized protein LOC111805087 n=1 Tax=Cucurbita pepo subsp. pepo TaxID=3664 RepID=UPI000C9D8295|nr:uncharacterized protein LOC111805087 [Cucurbita pepo subsp. pepo]
MHAGELLSFSPSSSSSATTTLNQEDSAATKMNMGVSANSSQAEQMERDLESLAFDDKLRVEDGEEEEDDDDDGDFSFVCANPDGSSPITADDAFYNGQIRPVYPLFNRDLLLVDEKDSESLRPPLRKVFMEKRDTLAPKSELELELEVEGVVEGTYCEWSPSAAGLGEKSNSTGFSKLWRFREFMKMHRSSSDGKDAYVFLSKPSSSSSPKSPDNKPHKLQPQTPSSASAPKVNRLKPQTAASAHETHYVRSRAQNQAHKRKSYLPYRQDLVGFFTTVNGFSKNVHPF